MATPALIYCGGGNPRFWKIATDAGFYSGARLPDTIYGPLYFADQDWRNPNRTAYMAALEKHRPHMATVLDWEREEQLVEVLDWAQEATRFVEQVVIVPKVIGGIARLPRTIAGATVVLGYSVPTVYAGTPVPIWSFRGWPVHLLGGSPHQQMKMWRYLPSEIQSIDGNMANKMAQRCQFWRRRKGTKGHWVSLKEADGEVMGQDANCEAFRRSCRNIKEAWDSLFSGALS